MNRFTVKNQGRTVKRHVRYSPSSDGADLTHSEWQTKERQATCFRPYHEDDHWLVCLGTNEFLRALSVLADISTKEQSSASFLRAIKGPVFQCHVVSPATNLMVLVRACPVETQCSIGVELPDDRVGSCADSCAHDDDCWKRRVSNVAHAALWSFQSFRLRRSECVWEFDVHRGHNSTGSFLSDRMRCEMV